MKYHIALLFLAVTIAACSADQDQADAYGTFEAVETIVSAEATGVLTQFHVQEGQEMEPGAEVGKIDPEQLLLRKAQLLATRQAIESRIPDIHTQLSAFDRQLAVQQQQMQTLEGERKRSENLLKAGAAPAKQLDDLKAQILLLEQQMALTRQQRIAQASALQTQQNGIHAETQPIDQQIRQIEDQIQKTVVRVPAKGIVTLQYVQPGEVVSYGKPLFKIADLRQLILRAYISGDQLTQIKTGQQVQVLADAPGGKLKAFEGTITWISSKAEFTPKIIQTREERVHLVYALKVSVPNADGSLKIGMPGELRIKSSRP